MTKPDLMAELAEVVRSWRERADRMELLDNMFNGGTILTLRSCADDIATHHAELEAVVRKAARYDWLASRAYVQDHDGGWSSTYHFYAIARHDGSTYKGATPYRHGTLDEAIDQAMRNSAREGL